MSETVQTLRWQPVTCLLLSIIGLAGSVYLTIAHFDTHVSLVCPDLGPCNRILTSNTSHFLGIPVPVLGLAYFVPMTLLCLPVAWRSPDRRIHLLRLILSILGIGMILAVPARGAPPSTARSISSVSPRPTIPVQAVAATTLRANDQNAGAEEKKRLCQVFQKYTMTASMVPV